jgi:hypothetical protein
MPTLSDLFPSKYLKAADLGGKPWQMKIQDARVETMKGLNGGDETKCVLYFAGAKKAFPLNRTNFSSVAKICGDDSDMWPGHTVEVYPTETEMKGEMVDCIRIRKPAAPGLVFTNPTPPKAPERAPMRDDDMDDSVPF